MYSGALRELNYDLIVDAQNADCHAARAALTSRAQPKDAEVFFRSVQGRNSEVQVVHDGRLVAIKWKLLPQAERSAGNWLAEHRIFDGHVQVVMFNSSGRVRAFELTAAERRPVFVMPFVLGTLPQNLQLGYYTIEGRGAHKDSWILRPCEDQDVARTDALAAMDAAEPVATPRSGDDAPVYERNVRARRDAGAPEADAEEHSAALLQPDVRRFSHMGQVFGSMLEAVNFFALRRLGLVYQTAPGTFDISDVAAVAHILSGQRSYTPDGRVEVAVGKHGLPWPTLVEIKPGEPSVDESARMYALAQKHGVRVLCIFGSSHDGGRDYGDRSCAPSMRMYVGRGSGAPPRLLAGLCWRWYNGRCVISGPSACPDCTDAARVAAAYAAARQDARQAYASRRV